jgi:hypothetical protein
MVLGGSAIAADDARSEWNDDRWVPSVALSLGFTSQKFNGSVSSKRTVIGFDIFDVRPSDQNQKYLNAIHVGGQFEMQSPAISIPYLHPRVIFGGEVYNVSSQSRSIAREGDPQQELGEPDGNNPFSALELLGRGSETTVDMENVQFGAHVGLSFPVQLGDWRVSIKPSARYLHQKLQFRGIVSEGSRGPSDEDSVPRSIPTNVVLLQGKEDSDLHAVGPGLEIEIAAGGVRNLAASVFISGGAYRVLSDQKIRFTDTGRDSDGTPFTTYTGMWEADIDDWLYRANIGFRIKWIGTGSGWLFGMDR